MSEDYYASLSDAELREILKHKKIKCGPITQTTRLMYVAKLARHDEASFDSQSSRQNSRASPRVANKNISNKNISNNNISNVDMIPEFSPQNIQQNQHLQNLQKSSRIHSTPITPPNRRSSVQYNINNSNNRSDPNIIDFSPYSASKTTAESRRIHSDRTSGGGSPGHTPFVGANKRIGLNRNNKSMQPALNLDGDWNAAVGLKRPITPAVKSDLNSRGNNNRSIISSAAQSDLNSRGNTNRSIISSAAKSDLNSRGSNNRSIGMSAAQSDLGSRGNFRHLKQTSYSYNLSSDASSDNTTNNQSKRRNRRSSSGNFRQSSVQTDSEYEVHSNDRSTDYNSNLNMNSHLNNNNIVDSRLSINKAKSSVTQLGFYLMKILVYGLLFLSLYLVAYVAVDWVKHTFKHKEENNLEKCIVTTLQGTKSYADCNKVNNHMKTIKNGNNSLSVSFLFSQCEHLLPKDHRLMESFVSMLKDISHTNGLVCYDHALNAIHCSDNIFYVAAIPPLLTRVICGFFLFFTIENLVTVCVSLGLAVFFIYMRSRKMIACSSCCINLEKSALFMLKRQRELFIKGFVEEMFLPISLIRDSLIPQQNRSKLGYYWKTVENKINLNKLVCCETIQISGVPTKCWKLLSNNDQNVSLELDELEFIPTKRWYPSLADVKNDFNKLTTKQIPSAPTCFIKIFGAHIAEQELVPKWDKLVMDALVERCNLAGAILIHCYVDATNIEGVVYMRTIDENSAAMVYNTINNMWLDGKQLTCKFLQRGQYLRKFADCTNSFTIMNKDEALPSSLN